MSKLYNYTLDLELPSVRFPNDGNTTRELVLMYRVGTSERCAGRFQVKDFERAIERMSDVERRNKCVANLYLIETKITAL